MQILEKKKNVYVYVKELYFQSIKNNAIHTITLIMTKNVSGVLYKEWLKNTLKRFTL